MEDIKNLARSILERGFLMSLATVDDGGIWAADVMYVFDDSFNIYWLSHDTVRHSKAILKNPQVAITITLEKAFEGLQISGTAEKIEGDIFEMAKKLRVKGGKKLPEKPGDILDPGESWYKITPLKIQLINEPLFGFKKQEVIL